MKAYIYMILLIMLISTASAYDYFSQEGFHGDTGTFVSGFTATPHSQGIGTPQQMPLISDLDDDGQLEIIIMDGGTFRVFHNETLQTADTASTGFSGHNSNFIAYDIDGDGLKELIVASETGNREIYIADYNNSQFTGHHSFNWNMTGALTPIQQNADSEANENEAALNCRAANDCAMVITQSVNGQSVNNLTAIHFNSTNATNHASIQDTTDPSSSLTCLPNIVKELAAGDYDNDGNIEYVIDARSVGIPTASITETRLWVIWFDASSSGITVEHSDDYSDIYEFPANSGTLCYNQGVNDNARLSSVTLSNYLGGSEMQTAIAYMTTSSKFIVRLWDSAGSNIDRFPDVDDVEGQLISNVVTGKFYASSSGDDFCAFGFDKTTGTLGEVQAMCGTLAASEGQSDKIYSIELSDMSDTSILFNITINDEEDYYRYNSLLWSADHSTSKLDMCNLLVCGIGTPANVDELVTPYGIFELTHDSGGLGGCAIGGNCALTELWQNPYSADGGMISYDAQNNGKDDILYMTSGGLYYLDDRSIDNPAYISNVDFNPCPVGTVVGINTTMIIGVQVKDPDGTSKVGARAVAYAGGTNEQDSGWSVNVTSGNTLTFTFAMNETITNGQIIVYGRDVANPDTLDSKTYAFTVQENGLLYNEQTCSDSFESPSSTNTTVLNASNAATLQGDVNNNLITGSIVQISAFTKLSSTLIMIGIMLFVTIALFMTKNIFRDGIGSFQGKMVGAWLGAFLCNCLILLIFTLLGLVSPLITITLFILVLVIFGLWVRTTFFPHASGGG